MCGGDGGALQHGARHPVQDGDQRAVRDRHQQGQFQYRGDSIIIGTIQQLRHAVVAPTGVGKNDGSMMHRGGW